MNDKQTGGPAFPCDRITQDCGVICALGITKREYFAAKAMQGLIQQDSQQTDWIMIISKLSYEIADAMLDSGK